MRFRVDVFDILWLIVAPVRSRLLPFAYSTSAVSSPKLTTITVSVDASQTPNRTDINPNSTTRQHKNET